jgi:protein-tyrosine-phosphatase
MKVVLFACIHNAGRSQLAAAWFNHLADGSVARAIPAPNGAARFRQSAASMPNRGP